MMKYQQIDASIRPLVNAFLEKQWFSTVMALRGKLVDMTKADGVVVTDAGEIVGLMTYELRGDTLEILSLDSLRETQGVGTALIHRALDAAKQAGCRRIVLVTTNDNIRAIRFYQKRGFDMARLYHDAMDESRRLKPEIPLVGEDGIPLRHELEFEYEL